MAVKFNGFNLGVLTTPHFLVALFIVIMCIQFVPLEGGGVSPIKVAVMAFAPLIFIAKTPQINKAFIWGITLWLSCFFSAYFAGPVRWTTLGYMGMLIMTFICFYSLMRTGDVTIEWFANLLKALIIVYGAVLILQQISVLIGLRNNPLLNLYPKFHYFIAINKLPILNNEPSHAARILAVIMLGFLECKKIMNGGIKITISELFNRENRWMTILFLWTMITMGSGTAFIALGIICIYFISIRNAIYTIPVIVAICAIGEFLNIEQFTRAQKVVEVTATGDTEELSETDGSAAVRITPLLNLFTKSDLSDLQFWFGTGTIEKTSNHYKAAAQMMSLDAQIAIIKQYGFFSFVISLIFVYTCVIKKVFSLETLMFLILFGLSINNIAYLWGALMIFAAVRYFQENPCEHEDEFWEEEANPEQ